MRPKTHLPRVESSSECRNRQETQGHCVRYIFSISGGAQVGGGGGQSANLGSNLRFLPLGSHCRDGNDQTLDNTLISSHFGFLNTWSKLGQNGLFLPSFRSVAVLRPSVAKKNHKVRVLKGARIFSDIFISCCAFPLPPNKSISPA